MADTPNRARVRRATKRKARRTEGERFTPYRIKKPIGQAKRGPSVPKARGKRPPGEPSPGTPAREEGSADDQRDPVVFFTYESSTDNTGPVSDTAADCSGADSEPGVVMRTGNWFADLSVDNGGTWKRFDPTTIFPNDLGSGFCCDQIVLFVPRSNIFVWFLQHAKGASGSGAFRIAIATPAAMKSDFTTAWTYWDFTADDFGIAGDDLDYPDLAASATFLYFSTDQMKAGGGRLIGRIPLKDLAAGGSIPFEYTDPSLSQRPYGSHLAQNSADGAFWVGHIDNATLQVFSLPDAGNTYSWTNVAIGKWPQSTLSSTSPSSVDWMTKLNDFPRYAVIGATRAGNVLWLAWSASKGKADSNTFERRDRYRSGVGRRQRPCQCGRRHPGRLRGVVPQRQRGHHYALGRLRQLPTRRAKDFALRGLCLLHQEGHVAPVGLLLRSVLRRVRAPIDRAVTSRSG